MLLTSICRCCGHGNVALKGDIHWTGITGAQHGPQNGTQNEPKWDPTGPQSQIESLLGAICGPYLDPIAA